MPLAILILFSPELSAVISREFMSIIYILVLKAVSISFSPRSVISCEEPRSGELGHADTAVGANLSEIARAGEPNGEDSEDSVEKRLDATLCGGESVNGVGSVQLSVHPESTQSSQWNT